MINKKIKFSDSFHGNLNVLFLMNAPKSDLIRLYAKYFMAIIISKYYSCHFMYANRKKCVDTIACDI